MTRSGPLFPSPDPLQRRMAEARQAQDEYHAAMRGRDARPGPSPRWMIALAIAALALVLNAGFLIGGLADPGPPDAADWAFRDLPELRGTAISAPCPAKLASDPQLLRVDDRMAGGAARGESASDVDAACSAPAVHRQ